MKNSNPKKKEVLGQYFTKIEAVNTALRLLFSYKKYGKTTHILEPSFGTGNFISVLKQMGFSNISGCEIDSNLTDTPSNFFHLDTNKKYDLIVGNPPFTKYNVKESYFHLETEKKWSDKYSFIPSSLVKKEKIQIENAFLLKAIRHLKKEDSTIGFVLPISFFIRKKNNQLKKLIASRFSTVIIYQNDLKWFEEPIPCCFAIFTKIEKFKGKIILIYENGGHVKEILDLDQICDEELIPKSYLYRRDLKIRGIPLSKFLRQSPVRYAKSYLNQNVTAANILQKNKVRSGAVEDYKLAVVRVGNGSVGKAGLVNAKTDVLNDMFYVFQFNEEYERDADMKEKICHVINKNLDYFRNITFRVGSKSIKKTDILNFHVEV